MIVERINVKSKKLFQQIRVLNPDDGIDELTDVLVEQNTVKQVKQQIIVEDESIEIIDGTG